MTNPIRWLSGAALSLATLTLLACGDDQPPPPDEAGTDGASTTSIVDDGSGTGFDTDTDSNTSTGGEPERADFAGASEALVRYAITTGMGLRAYEGYATVFEAEVRAEANGDECPTRAYAEHVMSMSASECTTPDGATYDGRVLADNAITLRDLSGEPTYDPSAPMAVIWQDFVRQDGGGRAVYDGTLTQSSPEATEYTARSVLAFADPQGSGTEDLTTQCEVEGEVRWCDITLGAADIDGLGTFDITGRLGSTTSRFYGHLELLGEQTLAVDFDTVVDGCHPYTIDGTLAGEICVSSPDPEQLQLELGYSAGCVDGELWLEGFVDAPVDALTMDLLTETMEVGVTTPLADPTEVGDGTWSWRGTVDPAAIEWSCDELEATSFRLVGHVGTQRDCESWGPEADRFPAMCGSW